MVVAVKEYRVKRIQKYGYAATFVSEMKERSKRNLRKQNEYS